MWVHTRRFDLCRVGIESATSPTTGRSPHRSNGSGHHEPTTARSVCHAQFRRHRRSTESTFDRVLALLAEVRSWIDDSRIRRVYPDLLAEAQRNPLLAQALMDYVGRPCRARAQVVLDRAAARGELAASADQDLMLDALGALVFLAPDRTGSSRDGRASSPRRTPRLLNCSLAAARQPIAGERLQPRRDGGGASAAARSTSTDTERRREQRLPRSAPKPSVPQYIRASAAWGASACDREPASEPTRAASPFDGVTQHCATATT